LGKKPTRFLILEMFKYQSFLAFSIIPLIFLVSISISFTNILGPTISNSGNGSLKKSTLSATEFPSLSPNRNINIDEARKLAEQHAVKEELIQESSELDYNLNLSDPQIGAFTFLTIYCYGNSKNDCSYQNAYISTNDYGNTWEIGFL
tara:strand:+ start:1436 stop:1879 length:444 start_codon:yes stop_codon:yes gene_type:complete